DNVAVVVHGQQHDDVGERERGRVQQRPHELLQRRRPERHRRLRRLDYGGVGVRIIRTTAAICCRIRRLTTSGCPGRDQGDAGGELTLDVLVVLAAQPAQGLEQHYHQHYPDAGGGEGAPAGNVP